MRAMIAAGLGCLTLLGCGGLLGQGEAEFAHGRYPEAKATFLHEEIAARDWSAPERAEYALYRGLTHAALGDRAAASAWLVLAKRVEEGEPGSLSERDASRLRIGLEELEMLQ
jgi:hypothetical protein